MKYKILYVDPPWLYNDRNGNGERGAIYKYKCMSQDELEMMASDIHKIADDDCYLFMWSTMPMLPNALSIIDFWGFTFKTVAFTWIKTNKDGTPFKGLGHYTRGNAETCLVATRGGADVLLLSEYCASEELCLVATKGKLHRKNKGVGSVVIEPTREHSRKPDSVRDRIDLLYGDVPRIELFARQSTIGWHTMGNEKTMFDKYVK